MDAARERYPRVAGFTVQHRGSFIKQFQRPGGHNSIVCFPFWELVAAAGCPFECAYCFLQATPSYVFKHYPLKGAIFENWREMVAEVENWLEYPKPRMLLVGELQDGLAFEGAYKKYAGESLTEMLVPLFAGQEKHCINFLTKATNIRFIRKMQPTPQVIFSWSVNAEEVGERWERKAPLPSQRLAAAEELKSLGWRIRLRLDPMVPIKGWQRAYGKVITRINHLKPEMVTLGALRASNNLRAMARKNGRDASIFDLLTEKDPAGFKWRLPQDLLVEMFRFALDRVDGSIIPSLCKEDRSIWSQLGMKWRGCNCLATVTVMQRGIQPTAHAPSKG